MQNLTRASEELFRRGPDERFATFDALWQQCQEAKARSVERWHPPTDLRVEPYAGQLGRDDATFRLNDWSFTQLLARRREQRTPSTGSRRRRTTRSLRKR